VLLINLFPSEYCPLLHEPRLLVEGLNFFFLVFQRILSAFVLVYCLDCLDYATLGYLSRVISHIVKGVRDLDIHIIRSLHVCT
jgi:hypothetical protein